MTRRGNRTGNVLTELDSEKEDTVTTHGHARWRKPVKGCRRQEKVVEGSIRRWNAMEDSRRR